MIGRTEASGEKLLVLLCPGAGAGRAARDFTRIEAALRARRPGLEVEEICFHELDDQVRRALDRGRTDLVAGGGDGTLNALVRCLMRLPPPERRPLRLGALGLGSSNDYLRPPDPDAWLERVQVALSERGAGPREVARLETESETVHYLMNSSVGLIARGCRDFAAPPLWLRALRGCFGYGSSVQLHTLFNVLTHPGVRARVRAGGESEEGLYAGITLLRCPHVAAQVYFRTERVPGDGLFDVVCLARVPPQDLPPILERFAREGPRNGGPVRVMQAREVVLEFPAPTLVEFDGEVLEARTARYSLVPDGVTMLGRGL